jgi:hypothetical protein
MNPTNENEPLELSDEDRAALKAMAQKYGFGDDIDEFFARLIDLPLEGDLRGLCQRLSGVRLVGHVSRHEYGPNEKHSSSEKPFFSFSFNHQRKAFYYPVSGRLVLIDRDGTALADNHCDRRLCQDLVRGWIEKHGAKRGQTTRFGNIFIYIGEAYGLERETEDNQKDEQDSPDSVRGERREERQQQAPQEQAFHPLVLKKLHEALEPDTPLDEARATLVLLGNLPLLSPGTKAGFLKGNLPVADVVNRLRAQQTEPLKSRLAALVQQLNFFQGQQAQASQQQEQPSEQPNVQVPPEPS